MGLDMYLSAKTYVNKHNYKNSTEEFQPVVTEKFKQLVELFPELDNPDIYGFEVSRVVGYWRKANAIHNWFVENVQKGEDNCQSYWVSTDDLEELRNICKQVLTDRSQADTLLPSQSGFFFGSTDYDEWYFSDLENTVTIINNLLDDDTFKCYDFYYQASW
jgi:hypothetical protein